MPSKLPLLPSGPGGVRKSAFHGPWRGVMKPSVPGVARIVSRESIRDMLWSRLSSPDTPVSYELRNCGLHESRARDCLGRPSQHDHCSWVAFTQRNDVRSQRKKARAVLFTTRHDPRQPPQAEDFLLVLAARRNPRSSGGGRDYLFCQPRPAALKVSGKLTSRIVRTQNG
jgi:hypothetical protein